MGQQLDLFINVAAAPYVAADDGVKEMQSTACFGGFGPDFKASQEEEGRPREKIKSSGNVKKNYLKPESFNHVHTFSDQKLRIVLTQKKEIVELHELENGNCSVDNEISKDKEIERNTGNRDSIHNIKKFQYQKQCCYCNNHFQLHQVLLYIYSLLNRSVEFSIARMFFILNV
jgi:hypothetical protein